MGGFFGGAVRWLFGRYGKPPAAQPVVGVWVALSGGDAWAALGGTTWRATGGSATWVAEPPPGGTTWLASSTGRIWGVLR